MVLNNSILKDKKKVALLYFLFNLLFWIGGTIVCLLIDIYEVKNHYSVTFGFLFTIPFALIILIGTIAICSYLWSDDLLNRKLSKLKLTIISFFIGRGILYVLPFLICCLIYFFKTNHSFLNIFSVFFGMMLSWMVNFATQLMFIQIDFQRMLKERSARSNVITGDSLKAN